MVEQVQRFVCLSWLFYSVVAAATPAPCGLLPYAPAQALEVGEPCATIQTEPNSNPCFLGLGAPLLHANWDILFHGEETGSCAGQLTEVPSSLVVDHPGPQTKVTFFSFLTVGKTEESLESTEGFRATEQGSQKPAADLPASACIPVKSSASAPTLWDGRKRGDAPGEPAAFPQGLPAGAEEQRQFLTEQCIASFHLCLSRFPQHYKSLYRLAFLYTYSKTHRVSGCWAEQVGRGVGSSQGPQTSLRVGGQNEDRLELLKVLGDFAGREWEGHMQEAGSVQRCSVFQVRSRW